MLNPRSFSEVLEELTQAEQHSRSNYSTSYESHLEAFGLSHILHIMSETQIGSLGKSVTPVEVKKVYPTKRQTKVVQPRPTHLLNTAQQSALMLLKSYCSSITANFNLGELKSAYRLSVLKTHPDQGGNSETFQEIKKSYHILLVLVKN